MPKDLKQIIEKIPVKTGTTYQAYAILPKKGLHILRVLTITDDKVVGYQDNVEDLKMIQIGKMNMEMDV